MSERIAGVESPQGIREVQTWSRRTDPDGGVVVRMRVRQDGKTAYFHGRGSDFNGAVDVATKEALRQGMKPRER